MKKLILSTILFCFLAVTCAFAQSVTIVPGASPTPGIKLSNVVANRRIVLWENGNNDHEFYGLGINNNTLRYQIPSSVQSHIFYAGASTTTSNELMRISGTGQVGIGTATPRGIFDVQTFGDIYLANNTVAGPSSQQSIYLPGHIYIAPQSSATNVSFLQARRSDNSGSTELQIRTQNAGTEVNAIRINSLGNVGIGTTLPRGVFDVQTLGDIYLANNTITGNGQQSIYLPGNIYIAPQSSATNVSYLQARRSNNSGSTELQIRTQNDGTLIDAVKINNLGRVGIGTTNPDAPLQVNGTVINTPSDARVFFTANNASLFSNSIANPSSSGNIQVHANGWYWADGGGFVATSDARIKNILGRTNTTDDLEKLRKIAVTDYRYIDEVSNGSTLQKKVIAQQVKEIFPIAINQTKGIIPNVYQVAKTATIVGNTTQIVTTKAHDFATGDIVKLIVENEGEKIVDVTVIDSHTFSVNQAFNDKVFVYGKQVNDLHNVDYDAISMLNVSATQELAKQVDALKAENASLKNSMSEMAAKVAEMDELKAQMASLKSLMLKTDNEKETVRVSENRK